MRQLETSALLRRLSFNKALLMQVFTRVREDVEGWKIHSRLKIIFQKSWASNSTPAMMAMGAGCVNWARESFFL